MDSDDLPRNLRRPTPRYRVIILLWLVLFVPCALSAYNGWRLLGNYDRQAMAALTVLGYVLLVRFRVRGSVGSSWTVSIADGMISTGDGPSSMRQLPIADLQRVVIATDDSGPWGEDVVFLLYSDASDPVGVFPLEAKGCEDFVGWLSRQMGYRDKEMSRAMGSTEVARFEVFAA